MSDRHVQVVIDATVAAGAMSLPIWIQEIEVWLQFATVCGGFALVIWRLVIASRHSDGGDGE